jgi:predicted DNA repair protein MutK
MTGAVTLVLSGGAFLLANKAISEVGDLVEPAKLLINAIIPQLVLGVVELWLVLGGGFLVVGVVAFVLNSFLMRKRAV